jgi:hypothetical protein
LQPSSDSSAVAVLGAVGTGSAVSAAPNSIAIHSMTTTRREKNILSMLLKIGHSRCRRLDNYCQKIDFGRHPVDFIPAPRASEA